MLTTNLLKKDATLIDHSEAAMLAPANVVEMDTRKYVQLLSAAQRKTQDCSTVSLGHTKVPKRIHLRSHLQCHWPA